MRNRRRKAERALQAALNRAGTTNGGMTVIEDELLLEGLQRAADAAGTVGATARMVADDLRMDSLDVVAGLDRLERDGAIGGETPPGAARWYSLPETAEDRAAADLEWAEAKERLL